MRANRTIRYFAAHIKKLPQLTSKEKEVLINRLKMVTLETTGLKYSVTEGRIRQIEKSALTKIRAKIYQQKLFKSSKVI
ncbi:hypothetical protein A2962_03060 [Candidatus Woesebacteria bacterium RIFCSPLOWO2_01_FULL_39_61]|uniref:RNA polymerase sigma-70 region 4 domain-containing protein n=1 Tax=Candidatus Woesebacteria bacterium RIFCSPHIGHO2_02_FULL_39_13 TaxID=1802505 RepID=A0A1F7Z0U0_9BACT|nr:MAG: hypothetical protein A2692_05940 [Candidatus Woesebacteria bacterium RIFCSPHIGHO2_01_FULL_39_95]OGM33157.1 MAG: hypothetical protein A3D01_04440 [Candidatus Woesebacteria bacterium RIFCSPHIGHO2_02_FULL_39_13]OGM36336.1 MAG: hypothetical protein A3E13_02780 [Candidatus Woesebacteria bacterium RIFCSPHIGHO2_12_FULL_40_20]OGM68398.1 MAG: hypothetical protein A2962_03060 [Candidatus Woesebacteria bacterium RIFCSPLOWO2_01_FULL_39_61]OGM74707.1 MAG: hypothetical protein A3H19_05895 [Candidatus